MVVTIFSDMKSNPSPPETINRDILKPEWIYYNNISTPKAL